MENEKQQEYFEEILDLRIRIKVLEDNIFIKVKDEVKNFKRRNNNSRWR